MNQDCSMDEGAILRFELDPELYNQNQERRRHEPNFATAIETTWNLLHRQLSGLYLCLRRLKLD